MANKSKSGQGPLTQMNQKMIHLDKKPVVENLRTNYSDEQGRRAFAKTKTAYNILQKIFENPARLDNLDAVISLSRCSILCNGAAALLRDFGKNAVEYSPHFEFNGPLEFKDESMDNIIGKHYAKKILDQHLICPTWQLAEIGSGPWEKMGHAILLFGPRDNGKTQLVCAAVKQSKYPYLWINNETVKYKWRGEACDLMSLLFDHAKQYERFVIVLDGINTMTSDSRGDGDESRESMTLCRTLCGLLNKERISKNTIVVAITNHPDSVDNALRSRFDQEIYVPLPNVDEREELFKLFISESKHIITDEVISQLADETLGFSGHDIDQAVQMALNLLQRDIIESSKYEPDILQERHLMNAVRMTSPTNNYMMLRKFRFYSMKYDQPTRPKRRIKPTNTCSCLIM